MCASHLGFSSFISRCVSLFVFLSHPIAVRHLPVLASRSYFHGQKHPPPVPQVVVSSCQTQQVHRVVRVDALRHALLRLAVCLLEQSRCPAVSGVEILSKKKGRAERFLFFLRIQSGDVRGGIEKNTKQNLSKVHAAHNPNRTRTKRTTTNDG